MKLGFASVLGAVSLVDGTLRFNADLYFALTLLAPDALNAWASPFHCRIANHHVIYHKYIVIYHFLQNQFVYYFTIKYFQAPLRYDCRAENITDTHYAYSPKYEHYSPAKIFAHSRLHLETSDIYCLASLVDS